jgi:hypothetical protein
MKVLVILFLTALVLTGCTQGTGETDIASPPRIPVETPPEKTPSVEPVVMEDKQRENCEELNNVYDRDSCYLRESRDTDTSDPCILIDKDSTKSECLESIARNTNDPSVCQHHRTTTYQNSCYKNVAIKLNNFEYCSLINEAGLQADCQEKIAIARNDESLCDQITVQRYKDSCHDKT